MSKSLSNKYGQKLFDRAKTSTRDAIKTASKRVIQKTAEATGDLIGNKIPYKIKSVSKRKSTKDLHNNDERKEEDVEITTHKKRYISPEERQHINEGLMVVPNKRCIFLEFIDELMSTLKNIHISGRMTTNYWWIKVSITV